MVNPFENALRQLWGAAKLGKFDSDLIERLSRSEREITVTIPLRMDDGQTRFFEGYRVQHNSLRGPYKGGIRFHPQVDLNEVRALAFWMTMKTAVTGISMGGGKGGVVVDPKELSDGELERLSRGFVRALYRDLGPTIDVPAPDVNTTPAVMAFMVDEYKKLTGDGSGAAFTGKPLDRGGSEGRNEATGLGGFLVFETLRKKAGLGDELSVAVQGIGNVGGHAAQVFAKHRHKVVAMSDSKGGIYNKDGLDPAAVESYKIAHRTLRNFPNAQQISNAELLELPVDVLVPAALEDQITEENAGRVESKLVLELANGPTTPEADEILHKKGVKVIPDILANAGGVVVSTFEWEQNKKNEHWPQEVVLKKLNEILTTAALAVWDKAVDRDTSLRTAAFIIALERLSAADRPGSF